MISPASATAARWSASPAAATSATTARISARSDSASGGRSAVRLRRAPGDRQGRHLVLERADVAAGDQLQVGHGPLQVEVRVVLPGEADAAEDLPRRMSALARAINSPRSKGLAEIVVCAGIEESK